MSQGKAFNAELWSTNPKYRQKYLDTSEPSRGFMSAKNPKAARMVMVSRPSLKVTQGQKITLAVKVLPGAPVSFFSPHLNRFGNGLTSMTVAADQQGIAEVEMEGVLGTLARTDVICSSPLCAGTAVFKITTVQSRK